MNEVTTVTGKTIANPIVIPGIRRATITMLSEQYKIPYTKLANTIYAHKDEYDLVCPKSKQEFETMLANDIQFVCKSDSSGNVGYLFTNAAFANIKFGRTPLVSARDIPKLIEYCSTEHRGRKKSAEPKAKPVEVVEDVKPVLMPASVETKTDIFDNSEEETLLLNVAKAYKSGEIMNLLTAAMALDSYRQREIAELKTSTAGNGIPWTSTSSAEKVVSILATAIQQSKYQTWCRVYDILFNDYGIDLRARAKRPLINGLKENEWYLFYQAVSDICKSMYIDIRLVLADAGVDTSGLSVMVKL